MMFFAISGGVSGVGAFIIVRSTLWKANGTTQLRRRIENFTKHKRLKERAILQISDEAFVASLLGAVLIGEMLCCAVLGLIYFAGFHVPFFVSVGILASAPFVSMALRIEHLDKTAKAARQSFSYALSSYLDLASVLLAGGSGTETALVGASRTGQSWAFRVIGEAIDMARVERKPIWVALGDLGNRFGVVDLERVAGSMQLAGEQGARVRASLATQAEALRARQISEIEAAAQAATERMGVPTVLLFVGFIALLGYPALHLVIGQM